MTDQAMHAPSPVSPEQVAELIRGRRSIVRFEPQLPAADIVRAAIDAARWAPNHRLTNPWRFYVLGPQTRDVVITLNTQRVADTRGADAAAAKDERWRAVPGWLVVTYRKAEDVLVDRENYAATACAIQNMMLYLHAAGVASKWTTGAVTRLPGFYAACAIDSEQENCVGLIWYGYAGNATQRSRRRPIDDILYRRD